MAVRKLDRTVADSRTGVTMRPDPTRIDPRKLKLAEIYPASTDGSHATEDEDCLTRTLLTRLDLPTEPVGRDDEDESLRVSKPAMAPGKDPERKASEKQNAERKSLEPGAGTDGGGSTNVSLADGNDAVE